MKNIVICCDGTGNEFGETNTNVVKIYQAIDFDDEASPDQIAFYDPGVGTNKPRSSLTRLQASVSKLLGLALGEGVFRNIADAYHYLMVNYEDGDRVYIFGFSRGAYTARALCGLLHMLGLLRAGNTNLIPYALALYRKRIPANKGKRQKHFKIAEDFKRTYSRECRPHFIGVWDTVKTVGIWDALKVATKLQTALPYTYEMPGVSYGRHAISIDERRSRFRTNLWQPHVSNDMQQVWFAGVHCDVGGGYPESGLSDFALRWMLLGAQHQGLRVRPDVLASIHPDPKQLPHKSLTLAWRLLGWKRRAVRGPGSWDDGERKWHSLPPSLHDSVKLCRRHHSHNNPIPGNACYVDDSWESYAEGNA